MYVVLYGQYGEYVGTFDTEDEAIAYINSKSCPDDYWICCDE